MSEYSAMGTYPHGWLFGGEFPDSSFLCLDSVCLAIL